MTINEAYEIGGRIPDWLDALSVGGQVTGIGMLIVFSVLIILMFVLVAMKYVFAPKEAKTEKIAPAQQPKAKTQQPKAKAKLPAVAAEEDEELIAVLTAAIAASLNTSTYNLNIKSFRRVGNNSPAWNKAGLNETINSRF